MTRSTMRAAVLVAASGALLAGVLSGCGAGQVTQTENQQPPIGGVNADSADGKIGLRDLAVEYAGPRGYAVGDNAPLRVRIVNSGTSPVRLTGVASSVGSVVLSGPGVSLAPSSTPPATPSSTPSAPPSGRPSGSTSAGASTSVAPTSAAPTVPPSPVPPPLGDPRIDVAVPVAGIVVLGTGASRYLRVIGLMEDLKPGTTIRIVFTFDNGTSITATVPIAVPLSPLPRSEMPLDHEE